MKNILNSAVLIFLSVFILTGCDPQESSDHKLGKVPTTEELSFSVTPSSETPNVLLIKDTSPRAGIAVWDFGNFSTDKGESVSAEYPFKGDYTITMTLYTSGGAATLSKTITIADNDFELLDTKLYKALTYGLDNATGKTWVFDSAKEGHFGVYPDDNSWSWNAAPNEKAHSSLYKQEFTFKISTTALPQFIWTNQGKVYTNKKGVDALAAMGYPNASNPIIDPIEGTKDSDYDVEFTPGNSYSFVMNEAAMSLVLTNGGFMGHYAGTSTYKIEKLTEDELELHCKSAVEPGNNWKYRFVPKK